MSPHILPVFGNYSLTLHEADDFSRQHFMCINFCSRLRVVSYFQFRIYTFILVCIIAQNYNYWGVYNLGLCPMFSWL